MPSSPLISLCIATYKRTDRLSLLIDDLAQQSLLPHEVIVVDNDAAGSARITIDEKRSNISKFEIRYDIQPERNIALTRNRTVDLSSGEWIAFIDDDERAPNDWLRKLWESVKSHQADGILGPVIPEVPSDAPLWIKRGRFYDFPRLSTGNPVPLNRMRFGNVVLRGPMLRSEPGPFDEVYGLTTGEDADLLIRLANRGAKIIWCDEAIVTEPVEHRRLSLRWLTQRAYSGGQEFARKSLSGKYGQTTVIINTKLFLLSFIQLAASCGLTLLTLPFGRHHAAKWLIRAFANTGKLSAFLGSRYREYA